MSTQLTVPCAEHPRASILIPAFGAERFGRCLESLARALAAEPGCEVVAVLNGAGEDLRAVVARADGLRALDPPINLGFAAGLNLARAAARGEYLVVLQDDTVVHEGWLEALVEVADAHPEAGVVCSVGLYPGGDLVQSAGVVIFSDCTPQHARDGTHVAALDSLEPYAADACSSAGMLIPARTWDAIGGLDETFFPLYWVDATLAMCVWKRGEAVLCAPQARVEHTRGQSTPTRFASHLLVRHQRLFLERWGEVLDARHEPSDDHGPDAMDRALERARIAWGAARPGPPPGGAAPTPYDPAGDVSERLRAGLRFARRALDTSQGYALELEVALDAREAELQRAQRQAQAPPVDAAELARLRDRSDTLAAIEAGGWWRLRGRLLPLIRLARRLRQLRAPRA